MIAQAWPTGPWRTACPGLAGPALSAALLGDCLEFLVALGSIRPQAPGAPRTSRDAEALAAVCGPRDAEALRALGRRLDRSLAEVECGFGHGDFWSANLLAEAGRLSGVIDWAGASVERLPLLDLFHLRVTSERRPGWHYGRTILRYLLPMARAGGDELVRAYCQRVQLEPDPDRLEDLAIAYWLDRVAQELGTFADRAGRPAWLRENVGVVLEPLVASGRCGGLTGRLPTW